MKSEAHNFFKTSQILFAVSVLATWAFGVIGLIIFSIIRAVVYGFYKKKKLSPKQKQIVPTHPIMNSIGQVSIYSAALKLIDYDDAVAVGVSIVFLVVGLFLYVGSYKGAFASKDIHSTVEPTAKIVYDKKAINSTEPKTVVKEKEEEKEKEKEKDAIADWVYTIFKIHTTVANQLFSAKDTRIHSNEGAKLDYYLYTGFFLYTQVCNFRKDADFASAFWLWYKYEATASWQFSSFTEEEIEQFVNMRIDAYDQIMQSNSSDKMNDLRETLLLFLAKDFIGNPLTERVAILPITDVVKLNAEVSSLWVGTLEKVDHLFKKVIISNFYVPYVENSSEDD